MAVSLNAAVERSIFLMYIFLCNEHFWTDFRSHSMWSRLSFSYKQANRLQPNWVVCSTYLSPSTGHNSDSAFSTVVPLVSFCSSCSPFSGLLVQESFGHVDENLSQHASTLKLNYTCTYKSLSNWFVFAFHFISFAFFDLKGWMCVDVLFFLLLKWILVVQWKLIKKWTFVFQRPVICFHNPQSM